MRQFGRFRLDVEKKVLWFDGEPVNLPLKEIEVLSVLTENGGEVVTRNEILDRVWTNSFVEESNLSRHIYLLRKTFKDYGESEEWIQTVPRRGYRFAGEIKQGELVIEKHSLTRTLIEQTDAAETSNTGRRLLVCAALLVAIVTSGFSFWRYYRVSASHPSTIKSLAVLPLKPLGNSDSERTLSLGTTDALITRIGSLNLLTVRSIPSADLEALSTARSLGVDAVLEGSLQRADDRVRVTVRLLRVTDGRQIWSGDFNETEADIFKLQDAISTQVAQGLSLQLNPQNRQLLMKRYTDNVEAYHAYLRGRFFFDKRNAKNYEKALVEFEQAIALDPNYALAYSGLADVYGMHVTLSQPRHVLHQKQRLHAQKAIDLNENLAEAQTSIAAIKRSHDWDWEGSEKHFKRAIELDPNYVNARQWYALLLTTLGRLDEAIVQLEKAREIEPLSKVVLINFWSVQLYRNDLEALAQVNQKILALEENDEAKLHRLALFYERTGDYVRAIEAAEDFMNNKPIASTSLAASLAIAYTRIGQPDKARQMLAYLEARPKNDTGAVWTLASVHAALGNIEEALQLVQKSFENHDDRMMWIKVEPRFDALRVDPRFQEILRKMKLI